MARGSEQDLLRAANQTWAQRHIILLASLAYGSDGYICIHICKVKNKRQKHLGNATLCYD